MSQSTLVGRWRNIVTITNTTDPLVEGGLRIVKRYIVILECGHKFVVHPNVRQATGCYFNPAMVGFFCTRCGPDNKAQ